MIPAKKAARAAWWAARVTSPLPSQPSKVAAPLAAALHLLQYERETWQLACEQLKAAAPAPTPIAPLAGLHIASAGLSLQG